MIVKQKAVPALSVEPVQVMRRIQRCLINFVICYIRLRGRPFDILGMARVIFQKKNPVSGFAHFLSCTPVDRASDSMMAPT